MQRKRRTLEHPAQSVENRTEQPRPSRPPERPHAMTAQPSRPRTVADLTAIPEVFGLTYWGAFKIAPNADVITAEVIANRDRLVADYKVEKLAGIRVEMDPRPRSEMDHPEVYALRGGGLLLLCSNYGTKRPPCVLKMRPIAPVYSTACTTYARTFPNVRELKAAIRAAGGRP